MSIRCGFFNSIGDDRRYDAEDMGRIFEGVMSDGVFTTMDNEKFKIQTIEDTMKIQVLSGKAWFNGKYFEIEKNTIEELTISASDSNPRYDAVYIKIDNTQSAGGRVGTLDTQQGTPGSTPTKPEVISTDTITKIVIGYVLIPANAESLNNATIVSNVGNTSGINVCPYAEVTLDPRRGMYIYEGESSVDPSINEMVLEVKDVDDYVGPETSKQWSFSKFMDNDIIILSVSAFILPSHNYARWIYADSMSTNAPYELSFGYSPSDLLVSFSNKSGALNYIIKKVRVLGMKVGDSDE